jgi:phenylacetate-CoA ligase
MKSLTLREIALYTSLSPLLRRNLVWGAIRTRGQALWDAERMEGYRRERLRRMIDHAAATVPYYRDLLRAAGLRASDIRSFDDLRQLPPLTRETLRERFHDLRSTAVPDSAVFKRSTGGTSGQPVTVVLDRRGNSERMLVNHRMFAMMGRSLGARTLVVAGSPIDSVAWTSSRDRLKNRLFNIDVISSFNLTPATVADLLGRLKSGRFPWVIAYASVFDILARHCADSGLRISIANIVPCAELVTTAQRERWREAFGCEIFEIYGTREMTSIAGEVSDHEGLAVSADMFEVDIADEGGRSLPNGTPGLITVTTLAERGMPLIRYQLGDVGTIEPPPAGSDYPFPRLRISHGRVLDVICCPDGKLLPGEFFPHLMKEVEGSVQAFQIIQPVIDRLTVRIVPKPSYSEETTGYLRRHIEAQVGAGILVEFEIVDRIETHASGKYRPTISMVSLSEKRFAPEGKESVGR